MLMETAPTANYVKCQNINELFESSTGWSTDFRVLTPRAFDPWMVQVISPELIFSEAAFGSLVEQIGSSPSGYRTFSVLHSDSSESSWNGERIDHSDLILMPQSGEFSTVSNPDFHILSFSLHEDLLTKISSEYFNSDWRALVPDTGNFYKINETTLTNLRSLLTVLSSRSIDINTNGTTPFKTDEILETAKSLAIEVISGLKNKGLRTRRHMPKYRNQCLQSALYCIEAHTPNLISIGDLLKKTGGSQRTLEYAFKQQYNLSPKKYVLARQLNFVMRDLRQKVSGDTTVTEVANYWGFSHAGQFAKDYFNLFGELPKETLKRPTDSAV